MGFLRARTIAVYAAFFITLFSVGSSRAGAQLLVPFYIDQGYDAALALAQDTLATDAYLVYAGTFGDLNIADLVGVPVTLNFYLDTIPRSGIIPARYPGQADAWGYVFYSSSLQQTVNLIAINLPFVGIRAQGVPVPMPLPSRLIDTLSLRESGARSDSMVLRLRRNEAFVQYHARYPQKQPSFVSLGNVFSDDITPPGGFEPLGPFWTVSFEGNQDTSGMICFVAARSGETLCQDFGISSAPMADNSDAALTVAARPNPFVSTTRVDLTLPAGWNGGELSVALFDASGELALDLGEPRLGAGRTISFDVDGSELPAGTYLLRVASGSSAVGVLVTLLGR